MIPDEHISTEQLRWILDGLFRSLRDKMQGVALDVVMNDFLYFVLADEGITRESRIMILEWAAEYQ